MKIQLDHKFDIGDMFHSHTTESIIVVTKLPDDDYHDLYYGVYTGGANEDKAQKLASATQLQLSNITYTYKPDEKISIFVIGSSLD